MRSLECLVKLYPNKTGKEILEIQEQDRLKDQQEYEKIHQKQLEIIEDFNNNGAYFKSIFGLDQHRYDRFFNLRMDDRGNIRCDVESIVAFSDNLTIDKRTKTDKLYANYLPQERDRITKAEFNRMVKYLDNLFVKFWGDKK